MGFEGYPGVLREGTRFSRVYSEYATAQEFGLKLQQQERVSIRIDKKGNSWVVSWTHLRK